MRAPFTSDRVYMASLRLHGVGTLDLLKCHQRARSLLLFRCRPTDLG